VKYCPVDVIPGQKIFHGRLFISSGFYFHFHGNPRIRCQFPSLQTAPSLLVRSLPKLQNEKKKPANENFVGTSAATMANII
jgi:hypothetical protein